MLDIYTEVWYTISDSQGLGTKVLAQNKGN